MGRSKILPVRRLSPEVAMQVNLVWEMARGSFAANSDRIVVPQNVVQSIGNAGLEELKYRLSVTLGEVQVIVLGDPSGQNIHIMKHPEVESQHTSMLRMQGKTTSIATIYEAGSQTTVQRPDLRSFGKKSKIPRPPNAFILYRQHFHPSFKQHNKNMHNNDISKELGKRWKAEPEHVKAKYKKLAQELKAKHAVQHPNYQYAPRKPGEKKRRMTTRKLAKLREARNLQETSTFPSPGSASIHTARSSSPTIECDLQITGEEINPAPTAVPDGVTFAQQPIQYQLNDMYTTILPNSFDNIQSIIEKECGVYGTDYVDVIKDVNTCELPEKHLLHANPSVHCIDKQNEWESLIDWHGLNESFRITEAMTHDIEDTMAEQAAGPDGSYHSYEDFGSQWFTNDFCLQELP
ncbi:hypothetical protein LTR05_004231 [Lithohypha guttulata]|uniref:HMG box domain-containing protein n=1 Tax=Lithohypha guttulata TaxID=1690604 RepID=A0AAN7YBN6_9EURO|nr:hypothetical protein LTR05_004231 [Lithohypha guttulata]